MQHTLELDSVLKTFGNYQLLTDVYLRIQTGDIIGLFGRNGSGKTVLLNILFGTMKAELEAIRTMSIFSVYYLKDYPNKISGRNKKTIVQMGERDISFSF